MRNELRIFYEVTFRFRNETIKSLLITSLSKQFCCGFIIRFLNKPVTGPKKKLSLLNQNISEGLLILHCTPFSIHNISFFSLQGGKKSFINPCVKNHLTSSTHFILVPHGQLTTPQLIPSNIKSTSLNNIWHIFHTGAVERIRHHHHSNGMEHFHWSNI